ncbi:MAG: hypothetical protein HPY74_06055 [Firmicutes bacterium]|nr:hypothetical protein [Bacillota bacterium]
MSDYNTEIQQILGLGNRHKRLKSTLESEREAFIRQMDSYFKTIENELNIIKEKLPNSQINKKLPAESGASSKIALITYSISPNYDNGCALNAQIGFAIGNQNGVVKKAYSYFIGEGSLDAETILKSGKELRLVEDALKKFLYEYHKSCTPYF